MIAQLDRHRDRSLDAHHEAPQFHRIAVLHLGFSDRLAVQEGPVPPADIGEQTVVAVHAEAGVAPRDARIVDRQVAGRSPADHGIPGGQRVAAGAAVAGVNEAEHGGRIVP